MERQTVSRRKRLGLPPRRIVAKEDRPSPKRMQMPRMTSSLGDFSVAAHEGNLVQSTEKSDNPQLLHHVVDQQTVSRRKRSGLPPRRITSKEDRPSSSRMQMPMIRSPSGDYSVAAHEGNLIQSPEKSVDNPQPLHHMVDQQAISLRRRSGLPPRRIATKEDRPSPSHMQMPMLKSPSDDFSVAAHAGNLVQSTKKSVDYPQLLHHIMEREVVSRRKRSRRPLGRSASKRYRSSSNHMQMPVMVLPSGDLSVATNEGMIVQGTEKSVDRSQPVYYMMERQTVTRRRRSGRPPGRSASKRDRPSPSPLQMSMMVLPSDDFSNAADEGMIVQGSQELVDRPQPLYYMMERQVVTRRRGPGRPPGRSARKRGCPSSSQMVLPSGECSVTTDEGNLVRGIQEVVDNPQPLYSMKERQVVTRRRRSGRPLRRIASSKRKMVMIVPPQPPAPLKSYPTMRLKYTFGVNVWQLWVTIKNAELKKSSHEVKLFNPDILQLTATELNSLLCLFVKEVRKPNGEGYAPDTIYYLCLGIQQYLYKNGRIDNIFYDSCYERFTDCLDEVAKKYCILYTDTNCIVNRVEEEHLWNSQQLGTHTPQGLLFTLMFYNTKYFNLTTVDEHMQLSFSHFEKHFQSNPKKPGTNLATGLKNVALRFFPQQTTEFSRIKPYYEQQENKENPSRCLVKLYEQYLCKCPKSVKKRHDVFYLLPERISVPDSPVWYSRVPLPRNAVEKMFNRIKMIKEINVALLTS